MIERMGWSERFDDPVPVPNGKTIQRLDEARAYILTLPRAEQNSPLWQDATRYMLKAAEARAWMWFARRALYVALHGESRPKAPRVAAGRGVPRQEAGAGKAKA